MDNDGDLDILSGEYYDGEIKFYENIAEAGEPAYFDSPVSNPFGYDAEPIGQPEGIVFSPADLDGDGDIDLFVSGEENDPSKVYYYENKVLSSIDQKVLVKNKLTAYPNPVVDEFVELKSDLQIISVELISALGQSLNVKFSDGRVYFPQGLSAGQYVIKAELENGQEAIQRITKK